jgi:TIR domain
MPPKIFISYSHADRRWKDRLLEHLGVLAAEDMLSLWSDTQLGGGDDIVREIDAAVSQATVAIFLVSASSLTSGFIRREELPRIFERRITAGLRFVPLIVRPCAWRFVPWLSEVLARPKDGRALSDMSRARSDQALADLVEEVALLIDYPAAIAGQIVEPPSARIDRVAGQAGSPVPAFVAYGAGLRPAVQVAASIRGRQCVTATVDGDGCWLMHVDVSAPCDPATGDLVEFVVDGRPTSISLPWFPGGAPTDVLHGLELSGPPAAFRMTPPTTDQRTHPGFDRPALDGITALVWSGGTVRDLERATTAVGAMSATAWVDRRQLILVSGAPDWVNQQFTTTFRQGVPAGTILVLSRYWSGA